MAKRMVGKSVLINKGQCVYRVGYAYCREEVRYILKMFEFASEEQVEHCLDPVLARAVTLYKGLKKGFYETLDQINKPPPSHGHSDGIVSRSWRVGSCSQRIEDSMFDIVFQKIIVPNLGDKREIHGGGICASTKPYCILDTKTVMIGERIPASGSGEDYESAGFIGKPVTLALIHLIGGAETPEPLSREWGLDFHLRPRRIEERGIHILSNRTNQGHMWCMRVDSKVEVGDWWAHYIGTLQRHYNRCITVGANCRHDDYAGVTLIFDVKDLIDYVTGLPLGSPNVEQRSRRVPKQVLCKSE